MLHLRSSVKKPTPWKPISRESLSADYAFDPIFINHIDSNYRPRMTDSCNSNTRKQQTKNMQARQGFPLYVNQWGKHQHQGPQPGSASFLCKEPDGLGHHCAVPTAKAAPDRQEQRDTAGSQYTFTCARQNLNIFGDLMQFPHVMRYSF